MIPRPVSFFELSKNHQVESISVQPFGESSNDVRFTNANEIETRYALNPESCINQLNAYTYKRFIIDDFSNHLEFNRSNIVVNFIHPKSQIDIIFNNNKNYTSMLLSKSGDIKILRPGMRDFHSYQVLNDQGNAVNLYDEILDLVATYEDI